MKGYAIPQEVKRYVAHDMIQAHTKLPSFANERIALLYAFLKRNEDNQQFTERMAAVTLLVQLGIDTHNTVEYATSSTSDRNMRSRQLKVLAGDYFSSRFYQMLAEAGQIEAIQLLSRAVCEVNRLKMTVAASVRDGSMNHSRYYEHAVKIKQCLFHAFNEWLNRADVELYEQLLDLISEREVIQEELENVKQHAVDSHSWTYWLVMEHASSAQRSRWQHEAIVQQEWDELLSQCRPEVILQERMKSVEERLSIVLGTIVSDTQSSLVESIVSELAI
ncbi:heptaprenyl diphosphate synthase component 1 [Paenibacillus agilis]|nr:heptaprenyl diphosphate synthase component 1 [Paenibacillus agilis]